MVVESQDSGRVSMSVKMRRFESARLFVPSMYLG